MRIKKFVVIAIIFVILIFSLAACMLPQENTDSGKQPQEMPVVVSNERYSVVPVSNYDNGKLVYSMADDNKDYYYYYLGYIYNVPLESESDVRSYYYQGGSFSETVTTKEVESTTVKSSCLSASEICTKVSFGFNASANIGSKDALGAEFGFSLYAENNNLYTSSESYSRAYTYSKENARSVTFTFDEDLKIGYYRYIMMGIVDVYAIVIRDRATDMISVDTMPIVSSVCQSWDYSLYPRFDDNSSEKKLEFDLDRVGELPEAECIYNGDAGNPYFIGDGMGTAQYPFMIETEEQLRMIGLADGADVYFKLANDISLTSEGWSPVNEFIANLDGNGKTLDASGCSMSVNITSGGEELCFGVLTKVNSGVIENLKVKELSIKSNTVSDGNYFVRLGGLVGVNGSLGVMRNVSIVNSSDAVQIACYRNQASCGMIAGANVGLIENCSAKGIVYSYGETGGIVGTNGGTVTSCSFEGDICFALVKRQSGIFLQHFGGIVGYSYGTVRNCETEAIRFNYYGEELEYHNIGAFGIHSYCSLYASVGTICGRISAEASFEGNFSNAVRYINLKAGDFHNTNHEKQNMFAHYDGMVGYVG